MLFNSFSFFVFLTVVFFLYWYVFNRSLKTQNILILIASYFFYGWWSYKFLGLLILSTLLDFIYGFSVASDNKRKAKIFLWLSVINNLGILSVFKYYNFFAAQFQQALGSFGLEINPALIHVVLPVGISFYTFHGMSYVFDIYRGKLKPVSNFVDYAVFVSFFPLLVAGPIERANHLLPQVQQKRNFNYTQAVEGCRLILWGLFKKVVIADNLSIIVDQTFNNFQSFNAFTLIAAAVGFSFQIYFDFSGYSDIAIGTAKLFGFELLSNFKFPYFSRDIAEFWRRWHISLSSWFKDYLYIPLGGSKGDKFITVRNIFIIFIVSGFWHGASWNFIVWGGIHACAFLPLLLLNKNRKHTTQIVAFDRNLPNVKELAQMIYTFGLVTVAWIFFRAKTIKIGIDYIKQIIVNSFQNPGQFLHKPGESMGILYVIPFICIDWYLRNDERKLRVPQSMILRHMIYFVFVTLILVGLIYKINGNNSFIYFQF